MNFIYDVLINFESKDVYDCFEWNENDYIIEVKKIPVFRVGNNEFEQIKYSQIKMDNIFLNKINNCTELSNDDAGCIDYACLFTNCKEVLGVIFNFEGKILKRGGLLLEETEDILEAGSLYEFLNCKYEVIKNNEKYHYLTRKEKGMALFLKKEIEKLFVAKNVNKLKYLFYEYFNKHNNNINFIYQSLLKVINDEWSNKHKKLYDLIYLSYQKEVMSKNP